MHTIWTGFALSIGSIAPDKLDHFDPRSAQHAGEYLISCEAAEASIHHALYFCSMLQEPNCQYCINYSVCSSSSATAQVVAWVTVMQAKVLWHSHKE